jgi:hypothetical protein
MPSLLVLIVVAVLVISIAWVSITNIPFGIGTQVREVVGILMVVWLCWLAFSILHFPFQT